jgi:hypothetical protein
VTVDGRVGADALSKVRGKDGSGCFTHGCAWRLDIWPVNVVSGDFPNVISVPGEGRVVRCLTCKDVSLVVAKLKLKLLHPSNESVSGRGVKDTTTLAGAIRSHHRNRAVNAFIPGCLTSIKRQHFKVVSKLAIEWSWTLSASLSAFNLSIPSFVMEARKEVGMVPIVPYLWR